MGYREIVLLLENQYRILVGARQWHPPHDSKKKFAKTDCPQNKNTLHEIVSWNSPFAR